MEVAARRTAGRTTRTRGRGVTREVPARIMAPRIVLYVMTFALTAFGLLMIYSSSSILCLTSSSYGNNPAYLVERQAVFAAVGLVLAVFLARVDYRRWRGPLLKAAWVATLILLALIYTPVAGRDSYGATRWLSIAGFQFQPSELAKVTVVLTGANLCERYYQDEEFDRRHFAGLLFLGVGIPLGLILLQPDKGTTGILVLTVFIMLYLSGLPRSWVAVIIALGVAAALFLALKDDYSRKRVLTMLDPFEDPFGDGYQLVQGFYAFGTGGLFGVGLGLSRQKYSYLPMAHNDFIFAVIGEELGLVGTIGTLAAFAVLVWAGLKIAENAPDLTGRLVAAGCTSLIAIQLLLNVCGVLGLFPLSGKPVPFISYGGSSIISCLMLVGLIASVSRCSTLPVTEAERRRGQFRVVRGDDVRPAQGAPARWGGRAQAPEPGYGGASPLAQGMSPSSSVAGGLGRSRTASSSYRPSASEGQGRGSLRVVEGGRYADPSGTGGSASRGRRGRVDLDADPANRLRSDDLQVRGRRPSNGRR